MGVLEEMQKQIELMRYDILEIKKKIVTLENNCRYDLEFANSQIDELANILGVNLDERILQRSINDGEIEADNITN